MSISSAWLDAKQPTKRSCEPVTSETVPNAGSAQSRSMSASPSLGNRGTPRRKVLPGRVTRTTAGAKKWLGWFLADEVHSRVNPTRRRNSI